MSGTPQREPINWAELDRLVDGQLGRDEYRELLRQIDKDPDGWRQCAMAFLQHQAMERELSAFSNHPDCPPALRNPENPDSSPATSDFREPTAGPGMGRLVRSLCLSGGILAAMVIGISTGISLTGPQSRQPGGVPTTPMVNSSLGQNGTHARTRPTVDDGAPTFVGDAVADKQRNTFPCPHSSTRSSADCLDSINQDLECEPHLSKCRRHGQ